MTKAEMRALTAALLPDPTKHPNYYRHPHTGAGTGAVSVHVKPSVRVVPDIKPVRPSPNAKAPVRWHDPLRTTYDVTPDAHTTATQRPKDMLPPSAVGHTPNLAERAICYKRPR
jgi:hypothetical protein